jgi:uncharacterized protein YbjT (DUF2867 family)
MTTHLNHVSSPPILVVGATGKTGRRVAERLMQDFSESFLLDAVRNGVIVLPAGDVREPFIDAEDIADLAVVALTQPGHDGRLYEVTGPQLLGLADAAAELSVATGRQIIYQPLSLTDYLAEGRRLGLAEELLAVYSHLFTETLDGRNAWITHGIQRGLGRSPRSFATYARRTAGTGVWQVAA